MDAYFEVTDEPITFELGEDNPRNREGREAQERAWALRQEKIDARVHYSIREALQNQRPIIQKNLDDFVIARALAGASLDKTSRIHALSPELVALIVEAMSPGSGVCVAPLLQEEFASPAAAPAPAPPATGASAAFRVCARVRPLSAAEAAAGEYSSVETLPAARKLLAHFAKLARSGRRLSMLHRWHELDAVFGADADAADVDAAVLAPLLDRAVSGDGDATVVLFGQTGSGKTFTLMQFLRAVQARLDEVAAEVDAPAEALSQLKVETPPPPEQENDEGNAKVETTPPLAAGSVAVTFYEVGVGGCCDLLNARAKVTLRADAEEVVHARGARRAVVASGAALKALLADALALRSTVATQANPISSRSHAICCIEWGGGGRTLRLVDLAGSERNYETLQMSSRAFLRESAEINKGLMALKDCFRASATKRAAAAADGAAGGGGGAAAARVPYRASMLTRVLRGCFEDGDHHTAVVAAVAPGAASVPHTMNSLEHVLLMNPSLSSHSIEAEVPMTLGQKSYEGTPPHAWTTAQLTEWLATADGGRFAQVALPPDIDGAALLAMPARALSGLVESSFVEGRADGAGWYVSEQAKIATALFRALRDAQSNGPLRGGKADAAATARRMRAQRQRDAEAAAAAAAAEEESAPIASPVPTPAAVAMAAQAEAAAEEASADDDEAQ